jgi:hypothetical protein
MMSAESTARPATAARPERIKLSLIQTIRPNSFKPHQSSPRINILMCHVNSCWPQAACHLHRANVTDSDKVGCGSITEQTQSGRYRQSWTVKLNFWTQFSRSDSELLTRSTAGPKLGAGGVTSRSHGRPAVPDHRVPLRVHFTHMMDWATSRIFYLCAKLNPCRRLGSLGRPESPHYKGSILAQFYCSVDFNFRFLLCTYGEIPIYA